MQSNRTPFHCFVPPHILDHMIESPDPQIRRQAVDTITVGAEARAMRATLRTLPIMAAIPSPAATKHRLIYDMKQKRSPLPGKLARSEGERKVKDQAVNEAYNNAGHAYDFYKKVFNRNSIDDQGMALIACVHYGRRINNAFWNGEQMLYGDGDGTIFVGFTKSLDVAGHEMTHGVLMYECNLIYQGEPGALNEHFADVMGTLIEQWRRKETVEQANWLIGDEIMGPGVTAKAIRTMKAERAYENDPILGTDPQPKHIKHKYTGQADNGGVHINSGIPNHAFYRVAIELGGYAWEKAGSIWYKTMRKLHAKSNFQEAAQTTYLVAGADYGRGSKEQKAVKAAWAAVGIYV